MKGGLARRRLCILFRILAYNSQSNRTILVNFKPEGILAKGLAVALTDQSPETVALACDACKILCLEEKMRVEIFARGGADSILKLLKNKQAEPEERMAAA